MGQISTLPPRSRATPATLQMTIGDDENVRHAMIMLMSLADALPTLARDPDQDADSLRAVVLAFTRPMLEALTATGMHPRRPRAHND